MQVHGRAGLVRKWEDVPESGGEDRLSVILPAPGKNFCRSACLFFGNRHTLGHSYEHILFESENILLTKI
jgi:hypothetical protein